MVASSRAEEPVSRLSRLQGLIGFAIVSAKISHMFHICSEAPGKPIALAPDSRQEAEEMYRRLAGRGI
jgi:hypothetical protein